MFIAVDIVGNIHFVNSSGAQKLGYSPDELRVKSLLSIVKDDDKKMVRECLFRLADRPTDTIEWKDSKLNKNGDVIKFQNEASFITTDCDTFILINCIDISKDKDTVVISGEQKNKIHNSLLRENEYRYRSIFDHHPDIIYQINQLILNSVSEGIYGFDLQSIIQIVRENASIQKIVQSINH
jgi:PAS domain S-box-containing protein